ncbi:hypothetical protein, partial [Streptomyces sp. NPDC094471]|uniref:hypothetical protein n=1 Tax=Streptomyces sp. NPDC094471 TaxID=3155209 RepID=UPI00331A25BE
PGSGLGLSIVARTVQQAGGQVTLARASGGGGETDAAGAGSCGAQGIRVPAYGSQSSGSGSGVWQRLSTTTGWEASAAVLIASITSRTCRASSPEARCGTPARIERAMSTTPIPLPATAPVAFS